MRASSRLGHVLRFGLAALVAAAPALVSGGGRASAASFVFDAPVPAITSCANGCYEPTVAVDGKGRIFATVGAGDRMAVSRDGGRHFRPTAPPPDLPEEGGGRGGDAIVQTAPSGRLYYSILANNGIQVAWSDDGARTWGSNTVVSLVSASPTASFVADRQWLAFGRRPGEVFLSYSQIPTGLWVLRSTDGGRTFPQFTRASPVEQRQDIGQAGPAVVGPSGRVYLPYFAGLGGDGPTRLVVATSDDSGKTFVERVAYDGHGGAAGGGFPILSVGKHEELSLTWWLGGGMTFASQSRNRGATWRLLRDVGPEGATTWTCPWVATHGKSMDVAAFRSDRSGPRDLVFTRLTGARAQAVTAASNIAPSSGCNTDFAIIAYTKSGCAILPYFDAKEGVLVARQRC